MQRILIVSIAIASAGAAGCGSSAPPATFQAGAPHGGLAFFFPNRKGSVEIIAEPAGKGTAGVSARNSRQLVAYFYQADGVTPLTPTPSDVKVDIGGPAPVALTPQDGDDKVGRFASPPGPYTEELRGTLEADVGGEPIRVPFVRR